MFSSIKETAQQLEDEEVLLRLSGAPNGDLVAVEARYHRTKSCVMIKYLNSGKAKGSTEVDDNNTRKDAFENLTAEFYFRIVHKQEVFRLTTLRSRYRELHDIASTYRSSLLKRKIQNHWKDAVCVSVPGQSNFVCSNKITIRDALGKVAKLKKMSHKET